MFKVLAPLAAVVAMAWAGAASAAVTIVGNTITWTGVIGPADSADWDNAPPWNSVSRWILGGLEVGGGNYEFHFISDATVTSGGMFTVRRFHYHEYIAEFDYYWGNENIYGSGYWNAASDPQLNRNSRGFWGTFSVAHPTYTLYDNGNWLETDTSEMFSIDMMVLPSDVGKPFTFYLTAVPEPATWAMMIIGFGAVGAALRARRRPVASAA